MSSRIFIGVSGGRQLFRISPPGYDAGNLSHPASFSSEGEYLRIHAIIDQELTRVSYYLPPATRYAHYGTYDFPALGYVPLAFWSIVHTSSGLNGRIFYPGDNNPATTEMRNDFMVTVSTNRIWCGTNQPVSYDDRYRMRAIIFKNVAVRELS